MKGENISILFDFTDGCHNLSNIKFQIEIINKEPYFEDILPVKNRTIYDKSTMIMPLPKLKDPE